MIISEKNLIKLLLIIPVLFLIAIFTKSIPIIIISILLSIPIIYEIIRRRIVQPGLRNILTQVVNKFNQHGIKYWVDYGSLLGIIRDKDIIKHDYDTDVCLSPNNPKLEEKLVQIVKELGDPYYLEYHPWSVDTFRIYKKGFLHSPYTDIYCTKLENGMYVDCSGKIPIEMVGKTQKIMWNGIEISIPEKVHETLVWRYGKSYMTPIMFKSNENFM